MKRVTLQAAIWAILLGGIWLVLCWSACQAGAVNLVRNASFEVGEVAKLPPDQWDFFWFWTGFGWSEEAEKRIQDSLWKIDDQVAHSGKRSAKICHRDFYNRVDYEGGYVQRAVTTATGDRTYTLSAYVKASKPTKCRLFLWGETPDWGPEYDNAESPAFAADKEWQRISHTVTFRPEIETVNILILRERNVLGGDLWIDDVQLEVGKEATPYHSQ